MMKSMTAYGVAEKTKDKINVFTEIRSYNSRHLDIALRMPHGYSALEEKIKAAINDTVARGRIEMSLQIKDDADEAYKFEINIPKAKAYHDSLIQLNDQLDLHADVSIDLLIREGGIIRSAEIDRDMEAVWPLMRDCVNEALDSLVAMREKEGEMIAFDIDGRINQIEKNLHQIEQESRDLLFHYQQRLKERIAVLTQGMVDINPERIAQEAAFLADKSDISEEILRVESHIKQFRAIMTSEEPAGRKLNFLLQELYREFNTMGSKTESTLASHIIVEVKSELEKIREQLQNVE
jgi:uncharacterized protein (TIGR00255 family)